MPGGGKTTVGKSLARRLDATFADVDREIELEHGCSVGDLFARDGEAAFRAVESATLMRLVNAGVGVIATGGGSVLRAENRALLREATTPIYLQATLAELWRRVRRNSRRPLLQVADPYARLEQLFVQRHPLYCEVARITVETGTPSVPAVVDRIVGELDRLQAT